ATLETLHPVKNNGAVRVDAHNTTVSIFFTSGFIMTLSFNHTQVTIYD
ncbi:hypothetical protein Q604_UNBc4C00323G0001, partial [human gut metagenome]